MLGRGDMPCIPRANRGSGSMVKNPCKRTVGDLKYVWSGSVWYIIVSRNYSDETESPLNEQGTLDRYKVYLYLIYN